MTKPSQPSPEAIRNAVRFPLKLPLAVRHGERDHQAHTHNISAGGVLFHVDTDLPAGFVIEFTIAMPGTVLGASSDVLVNCVGRVVRCELDSGRRLVAAIIDEYRFER
jgi:hypothetical protein